MEQIVTNPHLSTGKGAIIEGRYKNLRNNNKKAGTGSDQHYHPNELMIFPIFGRINAVVGKDRRIVEPGTFVHIPPNARHSMRACEDGDVSYLYVKDRTWSMIGVAADEAPPEEAPTVEEVAEAYNKGDWPGQKGTAERSEAIIDGLGVCFYPLLPSLDAPERSTRTAHWIKGARIAFGLVEVPASQAEPEPPCPQEQFVYILRGSMDATLGNEQKRVSQGDVIHVPHGEPFELKGIGQMARYAAFRPTEDLERAVDAKAGK
jgi:quercetin dioxygenase-like cupin family protein